MADLHGIKKMRISELCPGLRLIFILINFSSLFCNKYLLSCDLLRLCDEFEAVLGRWIVIEIRQQIEQKQAALPCWELLLEDAFNFEEGQVYFEGPLQQGQRHFSYSVLEARNGYWVTNIDDTLGYLDIGHSDPQGSRATNFSEEPLVQDP